MNALETMPRLQAVSNITWRVIASLPLTWEDPRGLARPLWRDYSYWNFPVNMSAVPDLFGACIRAGIGKDYTDPRFQSMWTQACELGLYVHSYHAFRPDQDVIQQADAWFAANPTLSNKVPRAIDMERQDGQPYDLIGEKMWEMSNVVLIRDGVRPMIYSRYMLINLWLAGWSANMLNEHWWWLAQYPTDRTKEHPGPAYLPQKVLRERVFLHQTCDKKPAYPGECGGSVGVDWDRIETCGSSEVDQWIAQNFGSEPLPPPPSKNELIMECIQDDLRVRTAPNTSAPVVRTLNYGDILHVIEIHGNDAWAQVADGYANIKLSSDRNLRAYNP